MKLHCLLPALIIVSPITLQAAATPKQSYIVIRDSTSPDGKYAVAWTLPKGPEIDWDKIRIGEGDRDQIQDFEDTFIQNNIIDVKSGRKLATLSSAYWELPGLAHPNHQGLLVAWSPTSDFVVVLHQLRFENYSLDAVRLESGNRVGALSFCKELETAVRNHLAKAYSKLYLRDKDLIIIGFGDLKALGDNKFSLVAYSGQPKRLDETLLADDSTATFQLLPGAKNKLSLRVLGFTKVDEASNSAENAAKAVMAADKELNASYQSLRGKIDAADRERLKQEQIEWLRERDQITDDWQRSRFIETRARDLKARAESAPQR